MYVCVGSSSKLRAMPQPRCASTGTGSAPQGTAVQQRPRPRSAGGHWAPTRCVTSLAALPSAPTTPTRQRPHLGGGRGGFGGVSSEGTCSPTPPGPPVLGTGGNR